MAAAPWRGSVGIIGLGLMGGSLARELAACGVHVFGWDADPAAMRAATEAGVLHAALEGSLDGLAEVELLVVAVVSWLCAEFPGLMLFACLEAPSVGEVTIAGRGGVAKSAGRCIFASAPAGRGKCLRRYAEPAGIECLKRALRVWPHPAARHRR